MLFVPALYPIVLSHSAVGFKYIEAQPNYKEQGCFDVFFVLALAFQSHRPMSTR